MRRALGLVGRAARVLALAVLVAVITCSAYLIVAERVAGVDNPTVFGYSTAVVMSGSMEPELSVGDLILNHAQDGYAVGDVITFDTGSTLTTHRIVGESPEGYVTQGDANNANDLDAVSDESIVGRVVVSVPYAGDVVIFLRSPIGLSLLLFAGFLILWLPTFLGALSKDRANEEES